MAHIDPSTALVVCERSLRELMSLAYKTEYGSEWLNKVASESDLSRWSEKADVERAKRETRGVKQTPSVGLEYAEFYQLLNIAEKHWEPLQPALGKKKETGALLKRFDDLRNTVAHSRETLEFEKDLLAGIAGEIRNRVAIFVSEQDLDGRYFPSMTSVVDSFGNAASGLADPTQSSSTQTGMTLHPGEIVHFTCSATDPQGRQLDWGMSLQGMLQLEDMRLVESGDNVTLKWVVEPSDVNLRAWVQIVLTAKDSAYHRLGVYDQAASFHYRVLPSTS